MSSNNNNTKGSNRKPRPKSQKPKIQVKITEQIPTRSRPSRRRAPKKMRAGSVAVGPIDQAVPAAMHAVAAGFGKRSAPMRRAANMHSAGMTAIKRAVKPTSFDLLHAMASPGEFQVLSGYPDADTTRSVVQNKIMDNTVFQRPASFTAETWSMVFLSLPSPELAGIALFYDGSLSNNEEIRWDCMQVTYAEWKGLPVWWKDLALKSHQPEVISPAPGLNIIQEYQPEMEAEAGAYAWPATLGTDISYTIENFRKLAGSITTELVCDSLTDQGIVYSLQMTQKLELRASTESGYYFHAPDVATTPATTTAFTHCNAWRLVGLPSNVADINDGLHYKGQARDGNYCIERWHGDPEYRDVVASRGPLFFSTAQKPDVSFSFDAPWVVKSVNGSSSLNTFLPIDVVMDSSRMPSIVAYVAMNKSSSLSFKIVGGFENTPKLGGPLTYFACVPPLKDTTFQQVAEGVGSVIPPGANAAANNFWDTLKQIGSTIWTVVDYAAPLIKAFAAMI